MRVLATLLLLATLVSCAAPSPAPAGEATVVEPGMVCRIRHHDGPLTAHGGIGGLGAPAQTQLSEWGIGGTGGPETQASLRAMTPPTSHSST
jgi:hypothetical protein